MPVTTYQYALFFFVALGIFSLCLTLYARTRQTTAIGFYTADGRISSWQNGLALAGDYLSAAAFLGGIGMYFTQGYDSLFYAVATLLGWPLLLLLLSEKLRQKGCYTVTDVVHNRFSTRRIHIMTACNTLIVSMFYLIIQMIGAGKLVELLFGIPYLAAVSLTGLLMILYVAIGGMLATTWVQMTKALLMLCCSIYLGYAVLQAADFSLNQLLSSAINMHPAQRQILLPSHALRDPLEMVSLAVGLSLGLLGLPHVLMRFFTVADTRSARTSACIATGIIALFFSLNALIGLGCIAFLYPHNSIFTENGHLAGGSNMALIHLTQLLGGDWLTGLVSAIAFFTILAVIAGLTLACTGALSHDLYTSLFNRKAAKEKTDLFLSRCVTVALTIFIICISSLFQHQNIAFLLGLAFAIAAASNFPLLLLTLYWPKLTEQGAMACCCTGLFGSILCITLGPTVWVPLAGFDKALFPYTNPALFTVPAAFLAAWLFSFRKGHNR